LGSAEIERRTISDEGGYFTVENLKEGADFQFKISSPGHENYTFNMLAISESLQPMRIELRALFTGTVAGIIVNTLGYPVPNYAMRIVSRNGSAG